MSAFTPGNFTDLTERCDQAQDDRGKEHQDLEEHQDAQLQEDNSYRCERDTGDEGGPVARTAGRGISKRHPILDTRISAFSSVRSFVRNAHGTPPGF